MRIFILIFSMIAGVFFLEILVGQDKNNVFFADEKLRIAIWGIGTLLIVYLGSLLAKVGIKIPLPLGFGIAIAYMIYFQPSYEEYYSGQSKFFWEIFIGCSALSIGSAMETLCARKAIPVSTSKDS